VIAHIASKAFSSFSRFLGSREVNVSCENMEFIFVHECVSCVLPDSLSLLQDTFYV